MEKQDTGSLAPADTVSETAGGHAGQVSEGLADFDRRRFLSESSLLCKNAKARPMLVFCDSPKVTSLFANIGKNSSELERPIFH